MKNPVLQYGEYTFIYFIEEQHLKMYTGGVQMRPTNWIPIASIPMVHNWINMLNNLPENKNDPHLNEENTLKKKKTEIISFPKKKNK